jgi:hypothetical protein
MIHPRAILRRAKERLRWPATVAAVVAVSLICLRGRVREWPPLMTGHGVVSVHALELRAMRDLGERTAEARMRGKPIPTEYSDVQAFCEAAYEGCALPRWLWNDAAWGLALPIWIPAAFSGALALWSWWPSGFGPGRCRECGYPLAGLPAAAALTPVCPECGVGPSRAGHDPSPRSTCL